MRNEGIERRDMRYTTHPRVVAGVMLMASLMLFSLVFAIAITLFGIINPPDNGYLTEARVLLAGAIATICTWAFWVATSDD